MSAAQAQPYDKVQFTPPKEVSTARPATAATAREQLLQGQRREGHSLASEMPAGMALPAPDEVNRARLLQSIIERRREQISGLDSSSVGGSEDHALGGDGASVQMTIDDLFDRYGMSRESGNRGGDNDSRYERRREESRRRSDDPSRTHAETRDDEEGGGGRDENGSESSTDFIPSMDDRDRDFRRSLAGETGRASEGFLRSDSALSGAPPSRDRDDAARARSERSEVIRKLIGGHRASTDLGASARAGGMDTRGVLGVPAAGSAPGTGRGLGDFMNSRPAAVSSAPSPDALGGASIDRSFAVPSRPMELNLRTGGGFRSGNEAVLSAPRPMQLFQQKHDSRIPARPF